MDPRRLFIAFPFSESLREKCLALQDRGRKQGFPVRWTRPEQIHLTLIFLGQVEAKTCNAVEAAMRKAAAPYGPFPLTFSGLGVFPSLRKARVLWLDVSEEAPLMALQKDLKEAIAKLGLSLDARPFHPHLTLGHFRRDDQGDLGQARRLSDWIQATAKLDMGTCDMRVIHLVESRLRAQGPEYHVRLRLGLGLDAEAKN